MTSDHRILSSIFIGSYPFNVDYSLNPATQRICNQVTKYFRCPNCIDTAINVVLIH